MNVPIIQKVKFNCDFTAYSQMLIPTDSNEFQTHEQGNMEKTISKVEEINILL